MSECLIYQNDIDLQLLENINISKYKKCLITFQVFAFEIIS